MRERLDANGLLDRGARCADERQWTGAIGYVTEAIDLGLEEERLPKALLLRGMCSLREGEMDSALGDFTSALNSDSSNETATVAYALRGAVTSRHTNGRWLNPTSTMRSSPVRLTRTAMLEGGNPISS